VLSGFEFPIATVANTPSRFTGCSEATIKPPLKGKFDYGPSFVTRELTMKPFPERAREFIEALKRDNAESQKQIDDIETTGIRIHDTPYGSTRTDVTDHEIVLLKQDISSRNRTIACLEKELRAP
jgi:hypothetical protein